MELSVIHLLKSRKEIIMIIIIIIITTQPRRNENAYLILDKLPMRTKIQESNCTQIYC